MGAGFSVMLGKTNLPIRRLPNFQTFCLVVVQLNGIQRTGNLLKVLALQLGISG